MIMYSSHCEFTFLGHILNRAISGIPQVYTEFYGTTWSCCDDVADVCFQKGFLGCLSCRQGTLLLLMCMMYRIHI